MKDRVAEDYYGLPLEEPDYCVSHLLRYLRVQSTKGTIKQVDFCILVEGSAQMYTFALSPTQGGSVLPHFGIEPRLHGKEIDTKLGDFEYLEKTFLI